MRFNPRARLDTSQIDDRTGGGGGLRGGGGGGGMKIGGGIGGLILTILVLVIFGPDALNGGDSTAPSGGGDSGQFAACKDAGQANDERTCRLAAITNSVQSFWADDYQKETGQAYAKIQTVPFTQAVSTGGCGNATSDAGPFYCPNDQRVYLDLSFFDTLLEQLGGKDTAFTEAYVVAHEYGHHIQNQLGLMGVIRSQQGQNSDAVKLETMADCLAGVWAKNATTAPDASGQPFISEITDTDILEGIAAAKVVGDDAIQSKTSGRVNPEGWTHGSSAQRIQAFKVGMREGSIDACNFFDPKNTNYPAS